jgi:single-strand DNA-binding protein
MDLSPKAKRKRAPEMGLPRISEVGKLWADPTIRYTAQGKAVTTVPLVFSKRKKDDTTGKWEDAGTLFVRGTLWEQYAEHAANSLTKGDTVLVTGELEQREYEKDGEKRQSLELRIYDIGPALKWAPVNIQRADRSSQSGPPADDPWSSSDDQAPF